jgi:hypothetical protein
MSKTIIIFFILLDLLIPLSFVSADCLDLGSYTDWIVEDAHTLVFYMGKKPLARLQIPNCDIVPSSSIRLIKSYVCDSDEIVIDGNPCRIISLDILY